MQSYTDHALTRKYARNNINSSPNNWHKSRTRKVYSEYAFYLFII